MKLNQMIDHTKLGAAVDKAAIDKLVEEARTYQFKSVCVTPVWVTYVKRALAKSDVLVCTVIGFPHGAHTTEVKALEAAVAIRDGADELDMVIDVNALKSGRHDDVLNDIKAVVKIAGERTVKVIIETCYLNREDIIAASKLVVKGGARFVKTSTGFGPNGAQLDDVRLMKDTVGDKAEVKASGGVRTYDDALKMIEAGATRIGTSNGVEIVTQRRKQDDSNTAY